MRKHLLFGYAHTILKVNKNIISPNTCEWTGQSGVIYTGTAYRLNLSGRSRGRRRVGPGGGRTKDTLTTITPAGTGRPLGSSRMAIWPGQCFRRLNPARADLPPECLVGFPQPGHGRNGLSHWFLTGVRGKEGMVLTEGWDLRNLRKLGDITCKSVYGRVWLVNHKRPHHLLKIVQKETRTYTIKAY